MRAYFLPLVAGIALAVSAFLPWVIIGEASITGVPDVEALWVAGLGAIAATLALLSLITRRNSRHPLLIIGLFALGITFLSWRIMPRAAAPAAVVGIGIYLGLAASCALVAFGLTIVVKRVSQPYLVAPPDDDV